MTADQGEGGSQLVRDRGDEARLEGIEGARLAQVPQDRDRAGRRARHLRVARRHGDRGSVQARDDLLTSDRPAMGEDLPERAGAPAAARAARFRQAAEEGFAGRPDPFALRGADEPRRCAVEPRDPAVRIDRDDRVACAVEDRGERRSLVDERATQLGGAEREGQLAPDEPQVASVPRVQRPSAPGPDREVAERDVARPTRAERMALLERDAEPAGAGRPAFSRARVREPRREVGAEEGVAGGLAWRDVPRHLEGRDPVERPPGGSRQPECGGAGAARAGDLRQDRRCKLLQVVAGGQQLAQLILGEHRVGLALGLVERSPPLVLQARDACPELIALAQ